jgi:hypothetical protein
MDAILKKLNYKDHGKIVVLNAPADLKPLLDTWQQTTPVVISAGKEKVQFALVFCTSLEQVHAAADKLTALAEGDAILWFCYPKGTSKKYTCDFNRDTGWARLGQLGWEPVRQVAIDDDWSALRFRNPDYIKTMTRSFAMTEKGKAKVKR